MSNISYLGIRTIFLSKIKEYFIDFQYTIISPILSSFIFILILTTINKYYSFHLNTNSYLHFVMPGIIAMIVIQTCYHNISETIINMKQIGSFNDFLIAPISRIEILFSLLLYSVFTGLFIGIIFFFLINLFFQYQSVNIFFSIYYLLLISIIFSSIGAVIGFLSFSWDTQSGFSNFLIIPISYLSGTFFSKDSLDEKFRFFFELNPFYYLISKFRNSFSENLYINFYEEFFLIVLTFFFFIISVYIFKIGYRVIQ